MAYASDRPLRIDVSRDGATVVVCLHGSARMTDADVMRAALEELTASEATPIVLDLADLDFICSTGLGAIISSHLRTRHYQGRICLVAPKPSVLQLLETTRLTQIFPVYPSVELAIE